MSVIAAGRAKGRQLHKFGGSSLADVKCYLRVAGIMAEHSQPDDMMVVSAAGSTTNQLISWLKLSQTDRLSAHQVQQALRRYQSELISGLLPPDITGWTNWCVYSRSGASGWITRQWRERCRLC